MRNFVPGWHKDIEAAARATSPMPMAGTPVGLVDDGTPIPPAFSLSQYNRWPYDQGQVGSCHANAAAKVKLIMAAFDASAGKPFVVVELSRWIVRYQCRKLDGTLNRGRDGGSIQNSMAAMGTPDVGGVGICHEDKAPYKADYYYLEAKPPQAAFDDALPSRVTGLAECPIGDAWCRSIAKGRPVCIGMSWYDGLDTAVRGGLFQSWGIYRGGHALTIEGWMTYQGKRWFQVENSHGLIYAPLAPEIAATIPGYKPQQADRTTDFWMPEDALAQVVDANIVAADETAWLEPFPDITSGLL